MLEDAAFAPFVARGGSSRMSPMPGSYERIACYFGNRVASMGRCPAKWHSANTVTKVIFLTLSGHSRRGVPRPLGGTLCLTI